MFPALLLAASACVPGACVPGANVRDPVPLQEMVHVAGDRLTLGDIANLDALPDSMREMAAGLVLMRFRNGHVPPRVSRGFLMNRAKRLMPALGRWLPGRHEGYVSLTGGRQAADAGTSGGPGCLQALRPVAAGALADEDSFAEAACGGGDVVRAFGFDRSTGAVRVIRALTPGQLVVRFAGYGEGGVVAGDILILRAGSGPVVVEREVITLQSARSGAQVFVRTAEGEVLAATFVEDGQ
jgi:hypothetical protein